MDQPAVSVLVERVRAGEPEAYAELYRTFRPRVLGLCRYLLGSRTDAEDAAGDIFARLPRAMNTYDATQPFPRWLLSVASHHCVDLLRKRRSEQRVIDPDDSRSQFASSAEPSPLSQVLSIEAQERLRKTIAELPELYRLPLVLRYYNELTYEEIARALHLSRNDVATRIFRAKKQLRAAMEMQGEEQS
jgi:RNA polymerase sigma-70 factor (ECF subfamily)